MAEQLALESPSRETASGWQARRLLAFVIVGAVVALLALFYWGLRTNAGAPIGGEVPLSRPAPDFTVTTFSGQQVKLSDMRGQVVVLNFWASWCVPCREEAAQLNAAYQTLNPRGTVFLGIAWNDTDADARTFMRQYATPYESARDTNGQIAIDYGITGVPETFVIDRDGRLTRKWVGPVTAPRLATMVEPLLR